MRAVIFCLHCNRLSLKSEQDSLGGRISADFLPIFAGISLKSVDYRDDHRVLQESSGNSAKV